MENLDLDITTSGEVTETGLVLRPDLSFDEWQYVVQSLFSVERSINWLIGDALAYGEDKFGEEFAQAVDSLDWKRQRVQNAAWVSRSVQHDTRRNELSWSHHALVASMDKDEQEMWLQRCADEHLSCSSLRKEISASKIVDADNPQETGWRWRFESFNNTDIEIVDYHSGIQMRVDDELIWFSSWKDMMTRLVAEVAHGNYR